MDDDGCKLFGCNNSGIKYLIKIEIYMRYKWYFLDYYIPVYFC